MTIMKIKASGVQIHKTLKRYGMCFDVIQYQRISFNP